MGVITSLLELKKKRLFKELDWLVEKLENQTTKDDSYGQTLRDMDIEKLTQNQSMGSTTLTDDQRDCWLIIEKAIKTYESQT